MRNKQLGLLLLIVGDLLDPWAGLLGSYTLLKQARPAAWSQSCDQGGIACLARCWAAPKLLGLVASRPRLRITCCIGAAFDPPCSP